MHAVSKCHIILLDIGKYLLCEEINGSPSDKEVQAFSLHPVRSLVYLPHSQEATVG